MPSYFSYDQVMMNNVEIIYKYMAEIINNFKFKFDLKNIEEKDVGLFKLLE